MNLLEEEFKNNKQPKKKGTVTKVILGFIIILVIAIIAIICYLFYVQNNKLKLFLDGQINNNLQQLLKIEEDGTIYVPIKKVASYFDYDSYNGEYTEKSEQSSKCYVQSQKEVANFSLGSNQIYKLDLSSGDQNFQCEYSEKPVKAIDGELYATSEMIEKAFNVSFQYDKNQNKITIYTIPYLIKAYSNKILDYGYSEISDVLSNQKTVLKDMLVVKNDKNKYAVINVNGNNLLEAKYDNITYLPGIDDFLVEANNKVGIISKAGQTKVKIDYDTIELMDRDAELYLVKKENKYGVIDFNGNTKINIEYDEIGIDISQFTKNNIKSKYLLADSLIPIRKDKLWGLYDKNGKQIVDFKYDSFGCSDVNNREAINLLYIPNYNVLVARTNNKYTLVNTSGQELFAAVADAIYMKINNGETKYYILANNQSYDVDELLGKNSVNTNTDSNINKNIDAFNEEITEKNSNDLNKTDTESSGDSSQESTDNES